MDALSRDGEEFMGWLSEQGRAVNTRNAYRRDLATYERWLHGRGLTVRTAARGDVESYVEFLRTDDIRPDPDGPARQRRPASVARSLAAVRGLHRFLVDEMDATVDPTADVGSPKIPQGVPKALTEGQVESLLAAVVGDDAVARRDRAILEMLYGTGMRISELVGLSLGNTALEEGLVRVLGKGSKERLVPVGGFAQRALAAWLAPGGRPSMAPERWARRDDADAVFLNARGGRLGRGGAWGIVRRHGVRAGLGEVLTPHVLRHSCATHMLDRGADIRVVQELLGHASIATTQVYTRVSAERLRSAYEAAHPRARRR
ncbi:MAG TPA: tyrosine recombinase [Acidimicrobiales bacterium]|nr:tyrosine recombinase [Acidimicrobiales bacterium]